VQHLLRVREGGGSARPWKEGNVPYASPARYTVTAEPSSILRDRDAERQQRGRPSAPSGWSAAGRSIDRVRIHGEARDGHRAASAAAPNARSSLHHTTNAPTTRLRQHCRDQQVADEPDVERICFGSAPRRQRDDQTRSAPPPRAVDVFDPRELGRATASDDGGLSESGRSASRGSRGPRPWSGRTKRRRDRARGGAATVATEELGEEGHGTTGCVDDGDEHVATPKSRLPAERSGEERIRPSTDW